MISIAFVAIECTCLIFLLVNLTAYIVLPRSGSLKRDGFFFCQVSLIVGLAFDMISWVCECVPSPEWLQYASNTLCLIASGFINAFFAYYIIGLIREGKPVSWLPARIIAIVNICGTAIVLIAAMRGKLFIAVPYPDKPDVMVYLARGIIYDIPNYLSALSLLSLFAIVLRNAKVLGKKKLIVFTIYFLLPMLASGLELINEDLQFSYAITSINMSIVYIMLQSRRMDELLLREKLLHEWSYVDALTGLQNRRAFDRDVEAAAAFDAVHIAFCDLNGLKEINDLKGHQAGDEYLMRFSKMLTGHFAQEHVYRISGDEFVVFARGIGADAFENGINGLRREIEKDPAIASLGSASGAGADISDLLHKAEINMYEDKDRFYQKNPALNRRRRDR